MTRRLKHLSLSNVISDSSMIKLCEIFSVSCGRSEDGMVKFSALCHVVRGRYAPKKSKRNSPFKSPKFFAQTHSTYSAFFIGKSVSDTALMRVLFFYVLTFPKKKSLITRKALKIRRFQLRCGAKTKVFQKKTNFHKHCSSTPPFKEKVALNFV